MMCSLVVIEVCIFPSCGRWSHCVPSVRETLERMRIDCLVCKRWPSQPAFSWFGLCLWGRAFRFTFDGTTLSLPLTMNRLPLSSWSCLQAGERGEHIQNWDRRAGAKDWAPESRGSRWIFNQETGMLLFFRVLKQLCVLIWKSLHYPCISKSFPVDLSC